MESLTSTDSASAKKETSRRPTSIWTVAGMAAISALFIYMIQTAFVVQRTETPQVSCRPEGVSKSDLSTGGPSFGGLAEQAAAGGRKMGGGRTKPEATESANVKSEGDTQERTSAEEDTDSSSRSHGHKGEDKPKMAHVFISTDETDLRPIFVVINSTLANAR